MAKISLNKLGEYLESQPLARRKIVENQKYPPEFIVTRYNEARSSIINYYTNGCDQEELEKGIESLDAKETQNEFQENDRQLSIQAIEKFAELDDRLQDELENINEINFQSYNLGGRYLTINDVDVSINPDIILKGLYRNQKIIGGLKFHFSKNSPLNNNASKNISALLHQFIDEQVKEENEVAKTRFIFSVDIFGNQVENAPRNYKRRINQIAEACEEIQLRWNQV